MNLTHVCKLQNKKMGTQWYHYYLPSVEITDLLITPVINFSMHNTWCLPTTSFTHLMLPHNHKAANAYHSLPLGCVHFLLLPNYNHKVCCSTSIKLCHCPTFARLHPLHAAPQAPGCTPLHIHKFTCNVHPQLYCPLTTKW